MTDRYAPDDDDDDDIGGTWLVAWGGRSPPSAPG